MKTWLTRHGIAAIPRRKKINKCGNLGRSVASPTERPHHTSSSVPGRGERGRTVRDMTRAPAGGMKISGTLKILPPRPPSFFHLLPPNLELKRSAMSRASSMCCFWSSPAVPTRTQLVTALRASSDPPLQIPGESVIDSPTCYSWSSSC